MFEDDMKQYKESLLEETYPVYDLSEQPENEKEEVGFVGEP